MIAQRDLWTPRTWTREERDFLLAFVDDTEESPWMVTTDLQQQVIDAFRFPLRHYAAKYHPEWYISTDLAVTFPKPDGSMGQVAPDVLVAVAPNHPRDSFDTRVEGGFPAFVLEVISPDYSRRDEEEKMQLYGMYRVEEYAIFNPRAKRKVKLQGYHRDAAGAWVSWQVGPRGELWSEVLGLALVADGQYLGLQDAAGHWILSEAEEAKLRAEEAEQAADEAEERAEAAKQEAEEAQARAEEAAIQVEEARQRAEEVEQRAAEESAARQLAEQRAAAAEQRAAAAEAALARLQGGE